MKKMRRYRWVFLLLVLIPTADYGWRKYTYWNDYERIVVWDEWAVALPQGGSLTYKNQSARMRLAGPADTTKLLIWQKNNGLTQEYLISNGGAGYRDIEFRIRPDGKSVWLISHERKQVVATLDLNTGIFTDEGGFVYSINVQQNMDISSISRPWAGMNLGRSLGRKKL